MILREHFERSGNWLFKHRGYLPLLLLAILIPALARFWRPGAKPNDDLSWEFLCLGISLIGLGIRAAVIGYVPAGTAGRNTSGQIAKTLNTSGLYSIVRHPLYLGNWIMWLGVMMFPGVWWCPVIGGLVFWLYYERIMFAEEEFLRREFGNEWLTWAERTPAIIPSLRGWRPTGRGFSIRHVLRREHPGLFALVSSLTALEIMSDAVRDRRFEVDPVWGVLFVCTGTMFMILRTMKHRTKLLHVDRS
jgi:protein-S-isoprenylcysteine O-methyltransferase Ste14